MTDGNDSKSCQRCVTVSIDPKVDVRKPGRPVTAGCVHERLVTLSLCPECEVDARTRLLWCRPCAETGHQVPVHVLTAAQKWP